MSAQGSVLIIDDDHAFRFAMRKALGRLHYDVSEAPNGERALDALTSLAPPDVALLDLRMDGIDGLEVLRRRGGSPTRIVVLTGHGTVQAAVDAMRLGAFSFLEKPVDAEVLAPLLEQAVAEVRRTRAEKFGEVAPPLVGDSAVMEEVRRFIQQVGPTDETVTIYGETGTGKEVVGLHLHLASGRRGGPFVAMNAACVPRALFESELFGHKKGSFTGATADRLGLFREADGGTLFIDELGELPMESQAKLLRALEARSIRPVGESKEVSVDVRIIAATNRDLWAEVRSGRFREDLYFRLQVFPVVLPPLWGRKEDLPALAAHLLSRIDGRHAGLSDAAVAALAGYDWPGNVRELLNVLRRACLFANGGVIDADLVRRMIAASVFGHGGLTSSRSGPGDRGSGDRAAVSAPHPVSGFVDRRAPSGASSRALAASAIGGSGSLADVERAHIERTLEELDGNVTRAAQALGIDRRTLQRKLKTYGISGGEG